MEPDVYREARVLMKGDQQLVNKSYVLLHSRNTWGNIVNLVQRSQCVYPMIALSTITLCDLLLDLICHREKGLHGM